MTHHHCMNNDNKIYQIKNSNLYNKIKKNKIYKVLRNNIQNIIHLVNPVNN